MLQDEQILDLFWSRDDMAIDETSAKYGEKLLHLAERMLRMREDCEECVNDTYLGAWNAIPPQRPTHFFAFLAKLCRNLACNKLDYHHAEKRNADVLPLTEELSACIPDRMSERQKDAAELAAALNVFLKSLPQENRIIFMRRYWFSDSYTDISKLTGFTEKNISVRLTRIRNSLRNYLVKEGVLL